MFSRRHYKKIAAELKKFGESPDPIQFVDVVSLFAEIFRLDNPAFNEQKFVEACGMSWEIYCEGG